MRVKINMVSPLLFFGVALITMPSFSVTASPLFDEIGFPPQLPEYPEGPTMVNVFSFEPDGGIERSWSTNFKKLLGMSTTSRVAMDPGPPQTHIPYYSFYKNAHFFRTKRTQKGNQIKELAEKVLELVNTLDYTPVSQNVWLLKELELVRECQTIARRALLEPRKLEDLERYWAIGIWIALEQGKKVDIHSEIEVPKYFNKQVYLEMIVTLHHRPSITKAFDHWVSRETIRPRAWGGRLEESLRRAQLIGKHDDERGRDGQSLESSHPIEKVVSEYLTAPELPQETDQVSGLLDQFREIFKNMKAHSWEGKYAIAIFRHILNFQSSQTINESLHRALQEEDFWIDSHTFVAKYDVVMYSKMLKQILSRWRLKSNTKLNLYSILKDPLQAHVNLDDAVTQLLLELKTISKDHLIHAYKLIMAHAFLRPNLERELLSRDSWKIVRGLQRAWAYIYPGLELPSVDVMDYQYSIFIKYPYLLAHAKWDTFINDAKYVSQDFSGHTERGSLLKRPETPYDVSMYTESYYRKMMTRMKGSGEKGVLYTMGLEMLMHLNNYLPKGQEYLLRMLKDNGFRTWVEDAIRDVRSHNRYNWNFWPSLFEPPRENFKLRQFVYSLNEIILFQTHEDYDATFEKWIADWPTRPTAKMEIGRRLFDFEPEHLQRGRTPWD